jgi:Ser/Thr protein kinase RdoA (MazF antagonist)
MDDQAPPVDALLKEQLRECYGLDDIALEPLRTPVNDVFVVATPRGHFALKLYNPQSRHHDDVQWEIDLVVHLLQHGAPVVTPIRGRDGYVASFLVDGQHLAGALFEWIPGEIPERTQRSYVLLGEAAARIHRAADTFTSPLARHAYDYDASVLIDEQLHRMKSHLVAAGRWRDAYALGERLKRIIANPSLDRGICHMDLTRANVHRNGNTLTVFDFDSAGRCWRSLEPYGVLRVSRNYLESWLEGYRSVRPFSRDDEHAVAAFGIVGDLRIVAWKLGVALSSRGQPLLTAADLPGVVDDWLQWESQHLGTAQ